MNCEHPLSIQTEKGEEYINLNVEKMTIVFSANTWPNARSKEDLRGLQQVKRLLKYRCFGHDINNVLLKEWRRQTIFTCEKGDTD